MRRSTLRKRGVSIEPGAITLARIARAVLDRDLAGERDQAGLGGAVGGVALRALLAERRRGVDDRAAVAGEHVRDRGAARPEDRREVGRDREVPHLLGRVDEPPRHLDRGVVVEHVEAAVRRRSRRPPSRRSRARATRRRAARWPRPPSFSMRVDGLARAVVVDVDDDDRGAVLGEQLRGGAALTRRRAGDQRDLAVELTGASCSTPIPTAMPATVGIADARVNDDRVDAAASAIRFVEPLRSRPVTEDPIETYGALFERDGNRYVPTPLTRGPWDPRRDARRRAERAVRARVRVARSRARRLRRAGHGRVAAAGAARAADDDACERSGPAARCSGSRRRCSTTTNGR